MSIKPDFRGPGPNKENVGRQGKHTAEAYWKMLPELGRKGTRLQPAHFLSAALSQFQLPKSAK